MRKKLFLTSAAVLWAVTAMNSVHAATDVQKVIDETYVQPEYVLGSSLSEDQTNQTLKKTRLQCLNRHKRTQDHDT